MASQAEGLTSSTDPYDPVPSSLPVGVTSGRTNCCSCELFPNAPANAITVGSSVIGTMSMGAAHSPDHTFQAKRELGVWSGDGNHDPLPKHDLNDRYQGLRRGHATPIVTVQTS